MNNIDLLIYTLAQPALNLAFGFAWGAVFGFIPFRRPLMLWLLLMVFVSVRTVGDWIFSQPHLPWEPLRLYVYASCFFIGIMFARYLRGWYQ
jgi:hypothetical protein